MGYQGLITPGLFFRGDGQKWKSMAKDPALMFYTQDFLIGTMFMSDEEVGIYIRLLCIEHQHGGIITKDVFNAKVSKDSPIRQKFVETDEGFFNERLMKELDIRSKKSSNMAANARVRWDAFKQKQCKSNAKAMQPEDEDEDGIRKKRIAKERKPNQAFVPPSLPEMTSYFELRGASPALAKQAFDHYEAGEWKDSHGTPVVNWKQKVLTNWINKPGGNGQVKPDTQPKHKTLDQLKAEKPEIYGDHDDSN